MSFIKHHQKKNNDAELSSQKIDDNNKIMALKRKRKLYINDIYNIDNKKLRITYIRSGLWLIVLGIICFVLAILITNIKNSLLFTLMTTGVTTFLAFLNIFIILQNRKYDDIQKINDIQYELELCNGYNIKDDIIISKQESIDNLIQKYTSSLNAGS
ncbi:hypothetical protein [Leuconostoc citreum]|uniref:hypothetical protein n=1 Tax=Leuconostoc citreum TaxID=33964 RepID=UPI0022E20751|nr:hypothetical protein [Leuconostoc citreum]